MIEMHSRDITLLIVLHHGLLQLVSVLFIDVPTLVENSKFFRVLVCNFFVNNFIMTGESTHTAYQRASRAPAISIIV